MSAATLADRYARAVLNAAGDDPAARRGVADELLAVAGLVRREPRLRALLERADLPPGVKWSVLEPLAAARLAPLPRRLLEVLVRDRRAVLIGAVADAAAARARAAAGEVTARVITAVPLDADARERLRGRLAAWLRRPLALETATDPGLVAGLTVRIGDWYYDGSVRGRLARLRAALTA